MFQWKPSRPFAVIDIEATGANARTDRIVELAVIKILPGGERTTRVFRVRPTIPISAEAESIHGIRNEDVANCPLFADIAREVAAELAGCDIGGYNVLRFDIPMLAAEFERANIPFDLDTRRVVDAQRIYHRREPRDLTAALAYYCGEAHVNAHGAEADAIATIRVLEGQFAKYADLPSGVDDLDHYCNPRDPSWVDRAGRFKWADGEIVCNFGKKAGVKLKELVATDPGFIKWILRSEFPPDTQELMRHALEGRYPAPPAPDGERTRPKSDDTLGRRADDAQ